MNETISVMYCFPRSGGTLLNQCLLCEPKNVVLSEINPAGSVLEPETQIAEWFGLATNNEITELKHAPYLDKIAFAHTRAKTAGKILCLRDWTGLNFLPHITTWVGQPSQQLEQRIYLNAAGYSLNEIALLRRSRAVYESIRSNIPELHELTPAVFAKAYQAYLEQLTGIEKFHLEDLIQNKQKIVQAISQKLRMGFALDFENRFHLITTVTGNNTLARRPESAGWTSIRSHVTAPNSAEDNNSRMLFEHLDNLAGYEPVP